MRIQTRKLENNFHFTVDVLQGDVEARMGSGRRFLEGLQNGISGCNEGF